MPGHILKEPGGPALVMAHLAEDTPVRAGYALYAADGAVGVPEDIPAHSALGVHVLGGYLPALYKGPQGLVTGYEPALAVGNGDGVHVPGAGAPEPWGLDAGDSGVYKP